MLQRILAIIQKEFSQAWRDRTTMGIMLTIPLLQLIIFGYAINTNVTHIPTVVADQSLDQASRAYLDAMVNSGYFDIICHSARPGWRDPEYRCMARLSVGIVIPPDFEKNSCAGMPRCLSWWMGPISLLPNLRMPMPPSSARNMPSRSFTM